MGYLSEKERNDIFDKISSGLQQYNEMLLRMKKSRGEKVCYAKANGKTYTITARTALKKYLTQNHHNS